MERSQLESIYKFNGLDNFKLKTLGDLQKVHAIDYRISGYKTLDKLNKDLYQKFLINFFNAWGLDARDTLKPTKVHYIKKGEYLRFDYEMNGNNGWLLVKTENQWY